MLKNISKGFLTIQTIGILACWILAIWAIVKSKIVGGEDDTLGLFVTGSLAFSIYLLLFWIINFNLIRKIGVNSKSDYLKLGLILLFSILPFTIIAGFVIQL
jgi:hypothetical protein